MNEQDRKLNYVVEEQKIGRGRLFIRGWAFTNTAPLKRATIRLRLESTQETISSALQRDDVFRKHKTGYSRFAGFEGHIPISAQGAAPELSLKFADGYTARIMLYPDVSQLGASRWGKLTSLIRRARRRHVVEGLAALLRGDMPHIRARLGQLFGAGEAKSIVLDLEQALPRLAEAPEPFEELGISIDILLPIHNGMDFLPALFNSLFENTTTPFRLIVIDDASPDDRIAPYLRERLAGHENVLHLRNQKNLGFVSTINRAAREVQSHFVILNSDTELPPHWLQRLMKPIIGKSHCATTTPMSNAATICSYPVMNKDNSLITSHSFRQIDAAFALIDASADEYDLPTGVGFCMGINKDAWDQLGGFDGRIFGSGYGEENDFCRRASEAGFRNLLVQNLYVYHKHGGSFGAEGNKKRQELVDRNLKTLNRLHPGYDELIRQFCDLDPIGPTRDLATLALCLAHDSVVLIIDHDIGGGTNRFRREFERRRLGMGHPVLVVTYDLNGDCYRITALLPEAEAEFQFEFPRSLDELLTRFPIGDIVCNNMVTYPAPFEIIDILVKAQKKGSHVSVLFHDYFPICPSFTLIDQAGVFCGIPGVDVCRKCLPRNRYADVGEAVDIVSWREKWAAVLTMCGEIVCFSEASRKYVERAFPSTASKIRVRPHALEPIFDRLPNLAFDKPLNIGVVGAINHAKGLNVVTALAAVAQRLDPDARITIVGQVSQRINSSNVKVTGRYDVGDMPLILEREEINVCLLPSIWPETFSYVAEELMTLRVPLCCFDIGAPAERIERYAYGRIIDQIQADAAFQAARSLLSDMRLLDREHGLRS